MKIFARFVVAFAGLGIFLGLWWLAAVALPEFIGIVASGFAVLTFFALIFLLTWAIDKS